MTDLMHYNFTASVSGSVSVCDSSLFELFEAYYTLKALPLTSFKFLTNVVNVGLRASFMRHYQRFQRKLYAKGNSLIVNIAYILIICRLFK